MTKIINLVDTNVDGCGTDVSVLVEITGDQIPDSQIIAETEIVIEKHKSEVNYEYDTDSVVEAVCKHWESKGYTCKTVSENVRVEF